jgi:hypothetical protein
MVGVGAPWPVIGELAGAGREGERGRSWGHRGGGGAWGGAATGGGDLFPANPCGCSLFIPCACVRKKAGKEKREKKRRREGKNGKFFQT